MSSKGKLAPAGPVANPNHINRGPAATKLPGTAKGQLGRAIVAHPNAKSKVTRAANIDPEKRGLYPKGMKGTDSMDDKSNPAKLPSKNRSMGGKGGKSSAGGTYSGPKGMKGAPEQGEYMKGTASTLSAKAPTRYAPPKGTGKNPR